MYWNTRRKPNSGPRDCSQLVMLSSIRISSSLFLLCTLHDRFDHALHPHEARSFHQHAGRRGQFAQYRGVERADVGEMAAFHRDRLVAEREDLLDAARTRVLADFRMELRA